MILSSSQRTDHCAPAARVESSPCLADLISTHNPIDLPFEPSERNCAAAILLVEDDPFVREAANEALQTAGYKIVSARNAIEALTILCNCAQPIDLLLTDIVMRGMGGFELAEEFRASHPNSRILLMSGHAPEFSQLGSSCFPNILLRKPFTVDELLAAVRGVLNKTPALQTEFVSEASNWVLQYLRARSEPQCRHGGSAPAPAELNCWQSDDTAHSRLPKAAQGRNHD
jgi:CheY-like chemotaxis protein